MRGAAAALLLAAAPSAAEVYFKETFDDTWGSRWVQSKTSMDLGKVKHSAGDWYGDADEGKGIQTSENERFYAISAPVPAPFDNKGKDLVVSYQVKDPVSTSCAGMHINLFTEPFAPTRLASWSKRWLSFGPDVCNGVRKVHLDIGYKGKKVEWKKTVQPESDALTHVYTAVLRPDNTYEVQIDGVKKESGTFEEDWAMLLPKEINDPEDTKPDDWINDPQMEDPDDEEPEGWGQESETIVDPEAEQPEDWDAEDDGEWEPPIIPNPKYQGKWVAKRIPNPDYIGVWAPTKMANPEYEADDELYLTREKVAAVGIELWQVKAGTVFDNIIVADSVSEVDAFIAETWKATKDGEKEMWELKTGAKEMVVTKEAGGKLGATWLGGSAKLKGAREGGPMARAGAQGFVGYWVAKVNGQEVETAADITRIAQPLSEVHLTWSPKKVKKTPKADADEDEGEAD